MWNSKSYWHETSDQQPRLKPSSLQPCAGLTQFICNVPWKLVNVINGKAEFEGWSFEPLRYKLQAIARYESGSDWGPLCCWAPRLDLGRRSQSYCQSGYRIPTRNVVVMGFCESSW